MDFSDWMAIVYASDGYQCARKTIMELKHNDEPFSISLVFEEFMVK
jgi:hypothetical protein